MFSRDDEWDGPRYTKALTVYPAEDWSTLVIYKR